jgi:flagellar biosynthesis anti-sigma factor FlgM
MGPKKFLKFFDDCPTNRLEKYGLEVITMVDEVNGVRAGQAQSSAQAPRSNDKATREPAPSERSSASSSTQPSVEVEISKEIQRAEERAEFDEAKVRMLKDQIAQGSYPIDSQKIAERFADLEQLL